MTWRVTIIFPQVPTATVKSKCYHFSQTYASTNFFLIFVLKKQKWCFVHYRSCFPNRSTLLCVFCTDFNKTFRKYDSLSLNLQKFQFSGTHSQDLLHKVSNFCNICKDFLFAIKVKFLIEKFERFCLLPKGYVRFRTRLRSGSTEVKD